MALTPSQQRKLDDQIRLVINHAKGAGLAAVDIAAELTSMATALGSDATTHDITIEAPPAALKPISPP